MSKLTYTTVIDLPDDPFEHAEVVNSAKPLKAEFEHILAEKNIVGVVTVSFDGRKAPERVGKTPVVVETLAPEPAVIEESDRIIGVTSGHGGFVVGRGGTTAPNPGEIRKGDSHRANAAE